MIIHLAEAGRLLVRLSGREGVYMKAAAVLHPAIVCLDRTVFLTAWAAGAPLEQAALAHGAEETWRADRKFPDAEGPLSASSSWPVPVGVMRLAPGKTQGLRFVDGVTRTIWLLANGARVIPVACDDPDDIDVIERIAGAREAVVRDALDIIE